MKLQHIKEDVCPTCGSSVVGITKDRQHTNGDWNESVKFECGLFIEYSPNYRRQFFRLHCKEGAIFLAMINKRRNTHARLVKYINRLKVDKDFKDRLQRGIKYVGIGG